MEEFIKTKKAQPMLADVLGVYVQYAQESALKVQIKGFLEGANEKKECSFSRVYLKDNSIIC